MSRHKKVSSQMFPNHINPKTLVIGFPKTEETARGRKQGRSVPQLAWAADSQQKPLRQHCSKFLL